ncbi:hypothetical protein [Allobacillus halotolerans]|uniref:PDZ domain-containing protein n=1 Tax=Allobacillus halotolerans TaxID=570278 RepID=A0ABS6GRB8_9BACI|nr:hypothetical protein [Allobacillus halotolerans]MBU6081445.1 hypothetical protein [Allobacillus halotolerans]
MWMEWLVEIGLGILRVTWQPLLYAAIIFAFWTGYKRIEKERKQFGHRIFEITAEWKKTWLTGLLFGLLLSIGILLTGGLISYEWMLFVSAVTLLFLLFNQTRLLSPIYTIGISALTIWLLNFFDITIINQAISDAIYTVDFVFVSYIMLVLFLAEIILVTTTKRSRTFPGLEKSDRGKFVGFHSAKRLMLIPFFVPIQGTALQLDQWLPWWPMFEMGSTTFSLMLFPAIIGFQQRFHSTLSDHGAKQLAKKLTLLFVVLLALAVGLYFYPEWVYVFLAVAIVGRLLIQWATYMSESGKRSIYSPQPDGIQIVGITPHSPADEMGLVIGEKIVRVHDHPVSNEHEFYEIMSVNQTYCKLSVKNLDGEVRFVQRPIYQNERHELGLVFVKEKPKFSLQPSQTEEFDLDEVVTATEKNQQKYHQSDSPESYTTNRNMEEEQFSIEWNEQDKLESSDLEKQPKIEQSHDSFLDFLESDSSEQDQLEPPKQASPEKLDAPNQRANRTGPRHTEQEKIEEPKNSEHNINEKALYEDELMSLIEELRSNEDDQKKD